MKIMKQLTAKVVLCAILVAFVFGNTDMLTVKAYGATSFYGVLSESFTALQGKMDSFEGRTLSESYGAEWSWGDYNWGVYTLAKNGKLTAKIKTAYVQAVKDDYAAEDPASPTFSVTKYATTVLVLSACGENVRNFDGKDLLQAFADPGCVDTGYVSGAAYIPAAIKAAGAVSDFQATMDAAVEYIESQQAADGSFGYDYYGWNVDIDSTGMVLEGLASYTSGEWKATASTVIKDAVNWLKTQEPTECGLYDNWGTANSATTACVTIGLAENKINPLTVIKNSIGKTALDGFLSDYEGNGVFTTDYQSQTLRALAALKTYYVAPEEKKESSGYAGSSTTVVYGTPVKTGTWNDPVTDGTWKQNADGSWTYTTNALFRSTWGYILNPYAKGTEKNQWFYFDTNGKMLTGWQVIGGKWYYLNTAADGSQGACLLNTTTPDGYTVNENGEWTVNGVVQTAGAAASAAQANGTQASASGTASKAGTSAGSSSGSGEEKPKTYSFSVSISANVKTDAGAQVDFSGSKTIKAEEDETYTAYDALESLCADKGYAIEGSSSYVSAINGLGEFDAGPTSGWMYSVNGKYPNVPAGDYEVKKGDKIRWVYVTKYTEVTDNF